LSQEELALRIGASSKQRIWQWERGAEQPRPHFVPILAEALNVPPMELLDCDRTAPTLSALRIAAGMTRDEVLSRAMIARMTYNRLDQGVGTHPPGPSIVRAIARVLKVTDDEVLSAIAEARATHGSSVPRS